MTPPLQTPDVPDAIATPEDTTTEPEPETEPVGDGLEVMARLDRDLKKAARLLGAQEVRYLVDSYYQIQKLRIGSGNRLRTLAAGEPNATLTWLAGSMHTLEKNIQRALDAFTKEYAVARWMRSLLGIGPVLCSGFLTHLDIRRAPTAGCFWRFAGLDPTRVWHGRKKAAEIVLAVAPDARPATRLSHADAIAVCTRAGHRWETVLERLETTEPRREQLEAYLARCPWNADLKRLCWLLGCSFVKVQHRPEDYYGKLYARRKGYESVRNVEGAYADLARASLATKNFGADTQARGHYEAGRLPPARLHLRAMRWAVKIFLAHLHQVMYVDYYGREPPVPYSLEKLAGQHTQFIPIPHWPWQGGGAGLREFLPQRD